MAAVEQGYMQEEIQAAALQTQRAIEASEEIVVGVNRFRLENEQQPSFTVLIPPWVNNRLNVFKHYEVDEWRAGSGATRYFETGSGRKG